MDTELIRISVTLVINLVFIIKTVGLTLPQQSVVIILGLLDMFLNILQPNP